ncbi:MAG: aldehyde dehydrogenase family protein, partial [Planctomycetota bacterium]
MTTCSRNELLIAGEWRAASGPTFTSTSPATGQTVWSGAAATANDVAAAVAAARTAQPDWADRPAEARIAILEACARALTTGGSELAAAIGLETGKPRWEVCEELSNM